MLRPQTESWCEAIVELLRSGMLDGAVGGSFWMLRPRTESWYETIVELLRSGRLDGSVGGSSSKSNN